jgi:acetolactate synthase-1/2/3 large subunit
MKVADYVIDRLGDYGIDKIFVVYGAANGDLIDAFTRTKKTSYVAVMHEQAGGFAAEAYAKTSGKVGAAIATSGPGGMNFVTPIGNCYYDSVPAIFITGQINSKFLKNDESLRQIGFQETDIVSIVKPITKYAKMITDPLSIKHELEKAIHLARSGRPGPVLLDIPLDIAKTLINVDALNGFNHNSNDYDKTKIEEQARSVLDDLRKSERPVLLVGGGVKIANAVSLLQEVSKLLQIPTFPTWNALDIVTNDLETYCGRVGTYGGAGRNFALQNSDLLITIGSRVSGRITGGNIKSFAREAKKIMIDVDDAQLQPHLQQVPFNVNIKCDAKLFLETLKRLITQEPSLTHKKWLSKSLEWKNKYDPVKPEFGSSKTVIHPYKFIRQLSAKMSSSDVLLADCGGNIVITSQALETKLGQTFITNNGNSPMGFSFAAAIGAWFADPSKRIICIIGDGGFNMNIQELQTIKNYGCNIKTFILNNHIYGITKAFQETNFQGRAEACGPVGYSPPNFVEISKAYGIKTISLKNPGNVDSAIDEMFESNESVVCDVDIHEYHTYEPRIFGWSTPIEDMYPYLDRAEFKSNMIIEPLEDWETPAMPDVVNSPETSE